MSHYDAVIVGSGPGGAMAAEFLVRSGASVLMLERGGWVTRGPESRLPNRVAMLSPHYSTATPSDADTDAGRHLAGALHCVGGQSVFYAAVALRYRERDFLPDAQANGGAWPFGYRELEPYYALAERLLGVSGDAGADPTEPDRSGPYPQRSPELSAGGAALHAAARRAGMRPFRPPLAISRGGARPACTGCTTCNGFACEVRAKGDASLIVADLVDDGLELLTEAAAVRILSEGPRATGIEYVDLARRRTLRVFADSIVLAAGALATPHLLLASGAHAQNRGARVVGRYLTRHCNGVVCGLFPGTPPFGRMSYKEMAVHDFYHGHPEYPALGPVGCIQQEALPAAMVEHELPKALRPLVRAALPHLAALIVMTEDEPVWSNRVALDRRRVNALGMPVLQVRHRHSRRDLARRRVLITEARRILNAAGAIATAARSIDTFSHAVGTVRMGDDPRTSALDADGRFRGFANLYVVDASALPTSAAVNPSLTIAAHALRVAERLSRTPRHSDHAISAERREAAHALA